MKNLKLLSLFLLVPSALVAKDLTAEGGLAKIDKNINVSESNIKSYQENLDVINTNISLLGSTQSQMETQKRSLQNTYNENAKVLANHNKEVIKIDGMITKEKNLLAEEKLKIQKLEALLLQLKGQQDQRNQNILELQASKDKFILAKDKGTENQKTLTQSLQEVDSGIKITKKEIQAWQGKRKANEREMAKWNTEKEKHLKMQEEIKVLLATSEAGH